MTCAFCGERPGVVATFHGPDAGKPQCLDCASLCSECGARHPLGDCPFVAILEFDESNLVADALIRRALEPVQ